MVKIELVTPQRHYIVTNQSTCLEGIIELIICNVEAIDFNERWPCRKRKGDIINKETTIANELWKTKKGASFNT
jgi:hypothetical protein